MAFQRPVDFAALWLFVAASSGAAQERPRFVNPSALPTPRGYTQLVEVPAGQRLLYLSGQVALDSAGALVGGTDFRAQAKQVFENLQEGTRGRRCRLRRRGEAQLLRGQRRVCPQPARDARSSRQPGGT